MSKVKERLKTANKKKNIKPLLTISLFSFLVISLNLAVWSLGIRGYLFFFEYFTAKTANYFINIIGIKTVLSGTTIFLPKETWLINTECTALFVMIIFSSFVVVYPAKLKQKAVALSAGIPAIFVINILRLLIMAWLTRIGITYERYFHDYVWQVAFIMLVVFFWITWIDWMVSNERKTSISG